MRLKRNTLRFLKWLCAFLCAAIIFTVFANIKVASASNDRIFVDIDSVPHNKVALLLGTNPLNRLGRPNTYFTNRMKTVAGLFHAGKVDFIIASGDNHTHQYDEPTAMRDSLIAYGVPSERIILDFAGFRTLDSVVRAKEIFGCDSLTIISQYDHCARALYLARANGIDAVAISAPLNAGRRVRTRLAIREWLARDKMMLDIWFGKQPHFLGEKVRIPDILAQRSYSTTDGMTLRIVSPEIAATPIDSFVVEFRNTRDIEGMTGEMFKIERLSQDGKWKEIAIDRKYTDTDSTITIIFNSIGWLIFPDTTLRMTVKPWFYEHDWPRGCYRLSKPFHYPPYPKAKSDTAYVEFVIK